MAEQEKDSRSTGAPAEVPFGEELRREREMREISIREISETTKISTRFLEAIEGGDFSSLPAPVFTRGFIREYASYLGLDSEEIVDRYMSIVEKDERRRAHEEEEMRERITGRFSLGPGSNTLKWILMAIVAITILGVGVYFLSRDDGPEGAAEEREEGLAPAPVGAPARATDTAPAAAESIRMTLSAAADSWIDVQVDDEEPVDFILQSGGTRTIEADERILFRTVGNAGAVTVELNGVRAEPLGRENQVVRNVEYDLTMVNEMLRQRNGQIPEDRSD